MLDCPWHTKPETTLARMAWTTPKDPGNVSFLLLAVSAWLSRLRHRHGNNTPRNRPHSRETSTIDNRVGASRPRRSIAYAYVLNLLLKPTELSSLARFRLAYLRLPPESSLDLDLNLDFSFLSAKPRCIIHWRWGVFQTGKSRAKAWQHRLRASLIPAACRIRELLTKAAQQRQPSLGMLPTQGHSIQPKGTTAIRRPGLLSTNTSSSTLPRLAMSMAST